VTGAADAPRDLSSLIVPRHGSVVATGEVFEPYRLVDVDGVVVVPVAEFLRDLQACSRSASTLRSYGMDLLRWFRFVWAIEIGWDRATSVEARDFCCLLQLADKPTGPHWRRRDDESSSSPVPAPARGRQAVPNAVTGKPTPGARYASRTVAHCETVLRGFYEFHLEAGSGPMVNPFPLARHRRVGRAHAHHNPMEVFPAERSGRFRPKVTPRVPRQIPDEKFDELFAQLGSHRDRALVAFWISTGARASELLGATVADADPGQQLLTVIRKGSRALQQVPASPDAFVWLRLYQAQLVDLVPAGRDQPLWWTLRQPLRTLTYHAARAMFTRANAALGSNWSLHDLRHSAAYRMARDPQMSLTDVQWVLGHAHLSTTQLYVAAPVEDMITAVLAHHDRRAARPVQSPGPARDQLTYRPESLQILFGRTSQ
jgi:site-specific recombinase XerC